MLTVGRYHCLGKGINLLRPAPNSLARHLHWGPDLLNQTLRDQVGNLSFMERDEFAHSKKHAGELWPNAELGGQNLQQ